MSFQKAYTICFVCSFAHDNIKINMATGNAPIVSDKSVIVNRMVVVVQSKASFLTAIRFINILQIDNCQTTTN